MYKLMSIAAVLVLVSALSISATVFAKGKPSSGSVVTFESGTISGDTYVEDGVTITADFLDIQNHIGDGDKEVRFVGEDNNFVAVNLGGATFDLTSINVEALQVPALKTLNIRSDNGSATIDSTGVATLNLTGITFVVFEFHGSFGIAVIDDIVINGGGSGNNGKKADKVICFHVDDDDSIKEISVNGNAVDAHEAHGDSCNV